MSEVIEKGALFELELELPNEKIAAATKRLVGFEARYQRLHRDLQLLADPQELADWSKKYHHKELPICAAVGERYPLVIFAGDVGTGKTATAEGACDRLARESKKEAMLFKLSTRVRGSGKVGQMSTLLNEAFEVVAKQAGKTRQAFLIIDEADSLASTRETAQSHHEDKVAVNPSSRKSMISGGTMAVFSSFSAPTERWLLIRPLSGARHAPRNSTGPMTMSAKSYSAWIWRG